jgi:hypothetical protein
MRTVTVGADRRIEVPLAELRIMDAVEKFRVFVEMTASAGVRGGDREVPPGPEMPLRMLLGRKTVMTIGAAQFAVNGGLQ